MSNRVDIALLCEDESHEQFIKKFLRRKHRSYRRVFPDGYKSRESGGVRPNNAFVLERAATEIAAARKVPPKRALILVIDGDTRGFASRVGEIAAHLKAANMLSLGAIERIALNRSVSQYRDVDSSFRGRSYRRNAGLLQTRYQRERSSHGVRRLGQRWQRRSSCGVARVKRGAR